METKQRRPRGKVCAALALEGELRDYFTVLIFLFLCDRPPRSHQRSRSPECRKGNPGIFVVIGLPCFILCKVLAEKPSFKNQMIFRDGFYAGVYGKMAHK